MNPMLFLREKKWYLLSALIVVSGSMAFAALADDSFFNVVMLICILFVLGMFIPLFMEYRAKSEFYRDLLMIFENLEKKNLITEMIRRPDFTEGMILYDILHGSDKACLDEIASYRAIQESYREYIELWVHEIKTPIASSKLMLQNAERNALLDSLNDELEKIEDDVQQVLFYSRSNNVDKDYLIKELSLRNVCNEAIRKNSKVLIQKKISVEMNDLDVLVLSDAKWIVFILDQIIGNAVKYSRGVQPTLTLSAHKTSNKTVLSVKDNGIGIPASELGRIFDKGFTGTNGRSGEKSTGMGLYIGKKLCTKLGLGLEAESQAEQGTTIRIIFPRSSVTDVLK